MSLISLLWLTSLPLLVLSATCPSPTVSGVRWDAATGRVTWAASAGALRCVRGYQVCWAAAGTSSSSSSSSSRRSCELVSAGAGGANLSGLAPCRDFSASVTAVNWNGLTSAGFVLSNTTGAPQITAVSVTQLDLNTTVLTWPTVSSYSCVEGINFSLCDSSGCWNSSLSSDVSSLELTELVLCRVYYLRIGTVGIGPTFTPKTFRIQLGALNVLASAKARNVTHQSANIWWLVSGARNTSCSSRKLRLCYIVSGGQAPAVCYSVDLGQKSASGSLTLQRLEACTAYRATLTLDTRIANNRTVSFVTPLTVGSLRMAVREVTSSSALVVWSVHANRTDCGPANVVLCLSRAGNGSSPKCGGRWQALAASSRLVGLQACTDYRVHLVVMTHTRPWPIRTQRLVTASQGSKKAVASIKLSATRDSIDVTWVVANSSVDCVHVFNVTWWSAKGGGGGWSAVDQRWDNFTISPVTAGLLYSVGVEAQLVGGTSYKLSSWVTTSGSTRNFSISINVLSMLIVIAFMFSSEIR